MTSSTDKPFTLMAKVNQIAQQSSKEEEVWRAIGRMARAPHDIDVLLQATLQIAQARDGCYQSTLGIEALQYALGYESNRSWERLWDEAHPDQLGQAWDGEDFALMSIWRKKVRILVQECHQELIFSMTTDEYKAWLTGLGCDEEIVGHLAEWRSEVMYEETERSA